MTFNQIISLFPRLLLLIFLIERVAAKANPIKSGSDDGDSSARSDKTAKYATGRESDRSALFENSRLFPFFSSDFSELGVGAIPGPLAFHNDFINRPSNPYRPGISGGIELAPSLGLSPSFSTLPVNGIAPHPSKTPGCAKSRNFCRYNDDYPLDQVNAIVDNYYSNVNNIYKDLHYMSNDNRIYYGNRTYNDFKGGHFVCDTEVDYIRPGWAKNVKGRWVAVINTDKFPQTIRLESCKFSNKRCEYLPPCYKSRCVQRYSYTKLLCVDPYRPTERPIVDVFEVPTACSCFVDDFVYY